MNAAPKSEALLVLRAQYGAREALELLLRGVQAAVLNYIIRPAGRGAAEDILQDVFLQVIRKLVFLREPEMFRAWACRIANATRSVMMMQGAVEDMPAYFEGDAPVRETFVDMTTLIDQLSPASRAVLHLHYVEDRPLNEVAAILEINLGTAKSRLAYGLSCLRKQVKTGKEMS